MSDAWKYRAIREIKEREKREMELIESRKDIKVSKTKADGEHLYINVLGFKNEEDWNSLFKNIQVLVLNWQGNL